MTRQSASHFAGYVPYQIENDIWPEALPLREIGDELLSGKHRHVMFWLGSVASIGEPSGCLSPEDFQKLVLHALLPSLDRDAEIRGHISEFLSDTDGRHDELSGTMKDLPFEQFLACLHAANRQATLNLVRSTLDSDYRNANHRALADVSAFLLESGRAQSVSLVTTNYDTCLDRSLEKRFSTRLPPVAKSTVPAYEVALPENRRLRLVKPHGSVTCPDSLVFTAGQMARLIWRREWSDQLREWLLSSTDEITLAVFAGYGFHDPDLYELIRQLTEGAVVIRNEPQEYEGSGTNGTAVRKSCVVLGLRFSQFRA